MGGRDMEVVTSDSSKTRFFIAKLHGSLTHDIFKHGGYNLVFWLHGFRGYRVSLSFFSLLRVCRHRYANWVLATISELMGRFCQYHHHATLSEHTLWCKLKISEGQLQGVTSFSLLFLSLSLSLSLYLFGSALTPADPTLLQDYRNINGRRIQIGGLYPSSDQEKGIALQEHGDAVSCDFREVWLRNDQSMVGGPEWTKMDLFRPK